MLTSLPINGLLLNEQQRKEVFLQYSQRLTVEAIAQRGEKQYQNSMYDVEWLSMLRFSKDNYFPLWYASYETDQLMHCSAGRKGQP